MEAIKKFVYEYRGAIIGGIVSIILLCTHLYMLIIGIAVVALGIFVGNYIQRNKYEVKDKIKNIIDRL